MRGNSAIRYLIGFAVTIGLLILLVILIFKGGSTGTKVPKTSRELSSYASSNAEAQLTVDGPVNNVTDHRKVRITVGKDSVRYELIQGYDNSVIRSESFASSEEGYRNFLGALEQAGFTQGDTNSDVKPAGKCATGNRYTVAFTNADKGDFEYWTTSCRGEKTFKGRISEVTNLFQSQLPQNSNVLNDASGLL